ncbi:MFS transporter [Nocardia sp. CA-135953]|uniref:MFS transporter n=1 Tax=Nocardia sp. CA-135953 TaxID=3239978 RepID=UPI003D95E78F
MRCLPTIPERSPVSAETVIADCCALIGNSSRSTNAVGTCVFVVSLITGASIANSLPGTAQSCPSGPRRPILTGLGLLATGGVVSAVAVFVDLGYPVLAVGLLLSGFGVAFALPALVTAIVNVAPLGTAGSVGGLLNAVRQVGATLGVAIMGALVTPGIGWSLLISAAVCAFVGIVFGYHRAAES